MQFDFDYFKIKMIADILWYLSWFLAWYISYKYYFKNKLISIPFRNNEEKLFYYLGLFWWAMFFWWFISTLDHYLLTWWNDGIVLSKTVAWAIAWWVISSELFKKIYNIKFNRWVLFIPSLCLWIIVWRIWAFFIWLKDHTHGVTTSLPWGYDYWDGIMRHPSQIYEIIVLSLIFIIVIIWLKYKKEWWINNGFYFFCLIYFIYRFLVGFIMPYSHFWIWMNTIQIVSIWMIIYSVYKIIITQNGK